MSPIQSCLQQGSRKDACIVAALSMFLWGSAALAAAPRANAVAPPSQEELDTDFIASLAELADLDVARQNEVSGSTQGAYTDMETIRERYPNRRVKVEREVTLDADGNYVNHGTWKMWNQAGKLASEGQYNMGKRVGVWTRWHAREDSKALEEYPFNRFQTPFVSQATFSNDELDGDWVIFDASQQKCSLVSFQNGMREGPAILWLPGGQVLREASYSQNVPVGDVLERDKAGKVMKVASYVDGRKVVSKSSVFPGTKDKRTEAIFLSPQTKLSTSDDFWNLKFAKFDLKGEELRNGPWKTWYTNGQVQLEGYYQLDKEVGTFTWWHENGQKAVQGEYTDSHQNSLWIWWHPNGQVASRGEYRNGAKIGQWRRWATDGRLEQQAMFDPKIPDSQQPSENLEFSKNVPVLPWLSR